MSIADPFTVVVVNETSIKSDGDLAPQYAMKVALKTLRDRCCKLQSRISFLEEENLQLRITREKEAEQMKNSSKKVLNLTDKKVDSYDKGESLWAKGPQSSKDKSQVQRNFISSSKGPSVFPLSKPISSSVLKHDDIKVKEDSLEEISLRGVGVYGRAGNSSKDELDGDANENEYGEENLESIDMALKEIVKKMKKDQETLRQQQEGLKSALEIFKKVMKENSVCKTCLKREESIKGRENKIVGTEESLVGRTEVEGYRARERIRVPIPPEEATPPLKDRICPLCGKYFHCSTPFDTFNEHVLSHFVEEEDEEKVSSNFEVVT